MQATRVCFSPFLKNNTILTTASKSNLCCSQRFISFSARLNEEEGSKTPEVETVESTEEVEPVKMSRRRRRFHEWMKEVGYKFSRPSEGTTNYLAATVRNSPFVTSVLNSLSFSLSFVSLFLIILYSNQDLLLLMLLNKKYMTNMFLIHKLGQFENWQQNTTSL